MMLAAAILIPMATAVLCLMLRRRAAVARLVSLAGAVALLIASVLLLVTVLQGGPVAAQMGGWPAPFGITLVADLLSAAMVLITGIVAVAVAVYGLADVTRNEERRGHHTLTQALLAGVCGAFLTGDMFNLYVWFEVMLIASFGLLVIGGGKAQIDGAVKYVGLNLIATLAFLTGVGLLYGATGTLNMADLHGIVPGRQDEVAILGAAALLLFAFGAKAAMFPVFFWLPAAYHTPSVTTSALFAALLTKVGVYALLRVFTLVFDAGHPSIQAVLLVGACLTMAVGVLGAAAQNGIRRILSFHIISQIGYMVVGLAIYTPLAIVGGIFYLFHHIVVKANLFLIGGLIARRTGSEDLDRIGGLWAARPWLGVLFLIPALSLAGIPPLSGFWAKLLIVQASLEAELYIVAAVALVVGLLTIFSMSKIWLEAFWKEAPAGTPAATGTVPALGAAATAALLTPALALAAITVVIGLMPGPFFDAAQVAADHLVTPDAYVRAVLGGASP
ncbi:Na+/H+ antiporter subunit D [Roseospira goensis]|uniref:Multicomponent Na+:H+ antiporter subunit D n=1 Tax=Roseospira goensis TaxID=391922 RepID=A0A7W6WJW7_9PROT|nr:Na+/H+ antiporter subunit D [Roseospira goensis]MBB4285089.1 multicomponent Na+:H+ antiporter subunit D [Roseospira goensis]